MGRIVGVPKGTFVTAMIYFTAGCTTPGSFSMTKARSIPIPRIHGPLAAAMAVAAFGMVAMLLVDHGPWNKPHLRTALVNYGTTSAAARAAGARVTPTSPKPAIEPVAPGPKPAQPANDVPL
jgi:hypothetical protein